MLNWVGVAQLTSGKMGRPVVPVCPVTHAKQRHSEATLRSHFSTPRSPYNRLADLIRASPLGVLSTAAFNQRR